MMTLYIKQGCHWCDMAEEWLTRNRRPYRSIDVLSSPKEFACMRRVSGQSRAPVLITENGRVLADFGPEELPGFLG